MKGNCESAFTLTLLHIICSTVLEPLFVKVILGLGAIPWLVIGIYRTWKED